MAISERVAYLLSPKAIRERSQKIFLLAEKDGTHFALNLGELDHLAELVISELNSVTPAWIFPSIPVSAILKRAEWIAWPLSTSLWGKGIKSNVAALNWIYASSRCCWTQGRG